MNSLVSKKTKKHECTNYTGTVVKPFKCILGKSQQVSDKTRQFQIYKHVSAQTSAFFSANITEDSNWI